MTRDRFFRRPRSSIARWPVSRVGPLREDPHVELHSGHHGTGIRHTGAGDRHRQSLAFHSGTKLDTLTNMSDTESVVREYYDRDPEREWDRHSRHRFEFPTTMHFLSKFMPAAATVLDLGGGPGRYAQALSAAGHTVDLVDISPKSVELARKLAAEHAVKIRRFEVANAVDLGAFAADSYDVVLNLGPLYHLIAEADRHRAILESLRVVKPGGMVAIGFISSYAHIYDVLDKDPASMDPTSSLGKWSRTSQVYREAEGRHFTDGFVVEPFQLQGMMRRYPVDELAIIGAEGLFAQSERRICRCGEAAVRKWIELCKEVADTSEAIAASIHVTYFGRKRK